MPKTKTDISVLVKCPSCGSSQTLARKRDRKRWCRRCLHEWMIIASKAA